VQKGDQEQGKRKKGGRRGSVIEKKVGTRRKIRKLKRSNKGERMTGKRRFCKKHSEFAPQKDPLGKDMKGKGHKCPDPVKEGGEKGWLG